MQSAPDGSTDLWQFVAARLDGGQDMVLLVVTASSGSAPGRAGFKMAVGADGCLAGTIGGGRIEHDLVETARSMLRRGSSRARICLRVHRPEHPRTSGMVCGGRQTVLLYPCRAGDRRAVAALCKRKPGVLRITRSGMTVGASQPAGRCLYSERICSPDTLYVVGGGHVGLALSRVAALLDFRVVVFDERPEVDTMIRNVFAQERRVVAFSDVGRHIPAGSRSYAVIMTPMHTADELVLRQLVGKRLRYLGLMASRSKAKWMLDRLRADGFADRQLGRVRCPVGLPIGSHTPAEIAVSIAAELVAVRNAV
jgi:xanthine dehydrogenase accessory factor